MCVCTSGYTCSCISVLHTSLFIRLHGVACGILVPQLGIEHVPPAMEAQSLNHWTSREVPVLCSFLLLLCVTVPGQTRKVFTSPMEVYAQCCPTSPPISKVSPPASVCTRTSLELLERCTHVLTALGDCRLLIQTSSFSLGALMPPTSSMLL